LASARSKREKIIQEKKKNTKSISRICGVLYIATVLAFLISNLILKNKKRGNKKKDF
jgi:hypothetical protein